MLLLIRVLACNEMQFVKMSKEIRKHTLCTIGRISHFTNAPAGRPAEELKSFSDSSCFMLKLPLAFIPLCDFNYVAFLACMLRKHTCTQKTHTIYVFIHFLRSLFKAMYTSSLDV